MYWCSPPRAIVAARPRSMRPAARDRALLAWVICTHVYDACIATGRRARSSRPAARSITLKTRVHGDAVYCMY